MATPGDGGREYKTPASRATVDDLDIVEAYDESMHYTDEDEESGLVAPREADEQRAEYLGKLITDQTRSSFGTL